MDDKAMMGSGFHHAKLWFGLGSIALLVSLIGALGMIATIIYWVALAMGLIGIVKLIKGLMDKHVTAMDWVGLLVFAVLLFFAQSVSLG